MDDRARRYGAANPCLSAVGWKEFLPPEENLRDDPRSLFCASESRQDDQGSGPAACARLVSTNPLEMPMRWKRLWLLFLFALFTTCPGQCLGIVLGLS